MKFNGYICIYLYALYTNTISSSLSVGKSSMSLSGANTLSVMHGAELPDI